MKKLLALCMAVIFILSLAACGKEEPEETIPAKTLPAKREVKETEEEEPVLDMTVTDLTLFSAEYPEDDDWVVEDDDIIDGDYWNVLTLNQQDNTGEDIGYVCISVNLEDCQEYRKWLFDNGFDAFDMVENDAYDRYYIGDVEFVLWEDDWGDRIQLCGRAEEYGLTIYITVSDLLGDEKVDRLLEGVTFYSDTDENVDYPWYWEGDPFEGTDSSTEVDGYVLESQWIPLDEPHIVYSYSDIDIAPVEETAHILQDGLLYEYVFDGTELVLDEVYDVSEEPNFIYQRADALPDGSLMLSGFGKDYMEYYDGSTLALYDTDDRIATSPDGTWGIGYFISEEFTLFELEDDTLFQSDFTLDEVSSTDYVSIDDDFIYVCGTSVETNNRTVFIYDYDFECLGTLDDVDGWLGGLSFIGQTEDGFIGLDDTWCNLLLWDGDGELIAEQDVDELLEVDSCHACAAELQGDGSILMVITQLRDDGSATELLVYRVDGF